MGGGNLQDQRWQPKEIKNIPALFSVDGELERKVFFLFFNLKYLNASASTPLYSHTAWNNYKPVWHTV